MESFDDTAVDLRSSALSGKSVALAVCGGIGAMEAPKLARCLRRLGASVYCYMTESAKDFVTPVALSWGADRDVTVTLTAKAEHLNRFDTVVVVPATANIIGKMANGILDDPVSSFLGAGLGRRQRMIVFPAMHDDMSENPFYKENCCKLKRLSSVIFGRNRVEEGKKKLPDPIQMADQIAHITNSDHKRSLLLMTGPTRSYIDGVRYISNVSTGALGAEIALEFTRKGWSVTAVSGPGEVKIPNIVTCHSVDTPAEMHDKMRDACLKDDYQAVIFAAAVLDYGFEGRVVSGQTVDRESKLRSDATQLELVLDQLPKIISDPLWQKIPIRVGFKLEAARADRDDFARDYCRSRSLSYLCLNSVSDLNQTLHPYTIYSSKSKLASVATKSQLAASLVNLFDPTSE